MLTLVVTLEGVKLPPTQIDWSVKFVKTGLVQLQSLVGVVNVLSSKQVLSAFHTLMVYWVLCFKPVKLTEPAVTVLLEAAL